MNNTEKIIKAIEMCLSNTLISENCSECPYKEKGNLCMDEMLKNCVDLINRQKEEIERLKQALHECYKHALSFNYMM